MALFKACFARNSVSDYRSNSIRLKAIGALFASLLFALLLIPGSAYALDYPQMNDESSTTVELFDQTDDSIVQKSTDSAADELEISIDQNKSELTDASKDVAESLLGDSENTVTESIDQNSTSPISIQATSPEQSIQTASAITTQADVTFAIYDGTDNSFTVHVGTKPSANSTYTGSDGITRTVTKVYTGFWTKEIRDTNLADLPWRADDIYKVIKTVKVVDKVSPKYLNYSFYNCTNLISVDFENVDTSTMTAMMHAFGGCSNLEVIYISKLWSDYYMTYTGTDGNYYAGCNKLTGLTCNESRAFAIYDETARDTNGSSAPTLTFHKQNFIPILGHAFTDSKGITRYATKVYGGIEDLDYVAVNSESVHQNVPWSKDGNSLNIVSVEAIDSFSPVSMYGWFWINGDWVNKLKRVDLQKLDTSRLRTIAWLFENCRLLDSIKLPAFSNGALIEIEGLFSGCSSLQSINLQNFNLRNVTSADFLFRNCPKLETIYVNETWQNDWFRVKDRNDKMYLNDGAVKYFYSTVAVAFAVYNDADKTLKFYKRTTIPVDGSEYDGKAASRVFPTVEYYDQTVHTPNSSSTRVPWYSIRSNVTSVTVVDSGIRPQSMYLWFQSFCALTSIDLSKIDSTNNISIGEMFTYCANLESLELDSLKFSSIDDISFTFYDCKKLTSLDLRGFDFSKVTRNEEAFNGCESLETIYVSDTWKEDWFTTTERSDNMYLNCNALVRFISTIPVAFAIYDDKTKALTFHKQYSAAYKAWIVPVAGINGNVHTFIDKENTSRTVSKVYSGLETINWNYYKEVYVPWYNDGKRDSITSVYAVDAIAPISMDSWFWMCKKIVSADLHKVDTSNCTSLFALFQHCESMTSVDVSTFDTSKVTTMLGVFDYCSSLTSVNLTSFSTDLVTNTEMMFRCDKKLVTIYAGNWNMSLVTASTNMFKECDVLIGGSGTKWDSSHTNDRTYARIDVSGTPGYFTLVLDPRDLSIGQIGNTAWAPTGAQGKSTITLPVTHENPVTHEKVTTNVTLTEGTHYTISYENNSNTGNATATITILGTCTENPNRIYTSTFEVTQANMANVSVATSPGNLTQLASGKYAFTSTALQPEVKLTLNGSTIVDDGENYDIIYLNNLDAGTATIRIVGKNNLSGTQEVTFEIEKVSLNDLTFSWIDTDLTYTGSAIEPKFRFTIKDAENNINTIDPNNYDVTYSNNTNAGTATLTIRGKNSIEDETKVVTFNIAQVNLGAQNVKVILSDTSYVYTGGTFFPSVTVMLGNFLVDPSEYVITPSDRTSVGTATVKVSANTAKPNCNFTEENSTATFEITPKSINNASLAFTPVNAQYTFTGYEITPSFIASLAGTTLGSDDFDVTYTGNRTNVGSVDVIITGKGNYKDRAFSSFKIVPADLANTTIALSDDPKIFVNNSYDYTGKAHTPSVMLTLGSYEVPSSYYKVTYSNNVNASTDDSPAIVTITPISTNFIGANSKSFTIKSVPISTVLKKEGAIKIDGMNYIDENGNTIQFESEYTGSKIMPNVVIKAGDTLLKEDVDYKITSTENINVGPVTLTVTGMSESLQGTHEIEFHIAPAKITNSGIVIDGIPDQKFDGILSTPEVSLSYHGIPLEIDKDYTVAYSDNKQPGEGHITITGAGNFAARDENGELISSTIAFRIVKGLVNEALFEYDPSLLLDENGNLAYTYDGTEHTPAFTLTDDEGLLVPGEHFTYKYINNKDAGTATIVIEGIKDYGGVINKTFSILRRLIDTEDDPATIVIDQTLAIPGHNNVFIYNGSALEPAITVTLDGKALIYGTDYTLSFKDNGNPGSAIEVAALVTVRGMKNYEGTVAKAFIIKKVPEMIEGHGQSWITESTEHAVFRSDAPNIEFHNVKVDGVLLAEDEHFTRAEGSTVIKLKPEFLATLSPGTHTIDIESLAGTARGVFSIAEKQKADDIVIQEPSQSTSTSASHKPNGSHSTSKPSYSTASWSNKKSAGSLTQSASTEVSSDDPNVTTINEAMPTVNSEVFGDCGASSTKSDTSTSVISPVWPWILVAIGVAALVFLFIILARRKKKED